MLPTSVSSRVSSWTSWGSVKAEYRPRWWRYRWGSSWAVMFLIESSIWRRLWLDKFTCRDKEKRSFLKRFTQTGRSKNDNQNYRTIMSPVAAGHSNWLHRSQSADPHSQTSQWGTTKGWSSPYTNMNYSSSVLVHAGFYCQPSVTNMLFSRIAKFYIDVYTCTWLLVQ